MRLPHKRLSLAEFRCTQGAARFSLQGATQAATETSSLIQSWVGASPVFAMAHHPPSDITDRQHGHLHGFAHAMLYGRKRRLRGENHWIRTAPSHRITMGLDARGWPVSIFTVNRSVTGGHWLDATTNLRRLQSP